MAHSIFAFVGRAGLFQRSWLNCPVAAALVAQNMRLVAMTHELWQHIHAHSNAGWVTGHAKIRVSSWREPERAFLARLSQGGAVAFIETNYFGGDGNQGAIAAKDGAIVLAPRVAPSGIINKALRLIGVSCGKDDFDEFDALGLGRFRDNVDILRAFFMADWMRAWFVFPELDLPELERRAGLHSKVSIRRAASGLYSCPATPTGNNPVEEFLMDKSTAMHAFELSKEDWWWMNDFFQKTRDVALLPSKNYPAANRMQRQTGVAFKMWSAKQAQKALAVLETDETIQGEFARFKSQIYHTTPPRAVISRFASMVEFFLSFFNTIEPGFVGILVDPQIDEIGLCWRED